MNGVQLHYQKMKDQVLQIDNLRNDLDAMPSNNGGEETEFLLQIKHQIAELTIEMRNTASDLLNSFDRETNNPVAGTHIINAVVTSKGEMQKELMRLLRMSLNI